MKWADRWREAARLFIERAEWPAFVTLTRSWQTRELAPFVLETVRAFHQLRRRRVWKKRAPTGMWFVEIQRAAPGQTTAAGEPLAPGAVRVHLHVLIDCKWIVKRALSLAWERLTRPRGGGEGAGDYIVDLHRISERHQGKDGPTLPLRAVATYVAKYLTKAAAAPELARRRLCQTWGLFALACRVEAMHPDAPACERCGGHLYSTLGVGAVAPQLRGG